MTSTETRDDVADTRLDDDLVRFITDADARRDPYPFYRRMREEDPVHWSPALGFWFITSWADVNALIRDRRWSSDQRSGAGPSSELLESGTARRVFSEIVAFRDPPDHTRLRSLITPVFTASGAEAERRRFEERINAMLDEVLPAGELEFVSTIARRLPMQMIADVLGLPMPELDQLRSWVDAFVLMLDVSVTPEHERIGDEAFADFREYLLPVLEERRRSPRDDLISYFADAERDGQLTLDELAAFALFLFVAGHESTTFLLGNGLAALLQHRDQWELFVADPDGRKQNLVEELLRFESSGRILFPRWPTEDVELGGQTIAAGDMVIGVNSAANRDPAVFDDPERLDILRRNANRHFAFGGGAHLCSGAALARVEVQEVFAAIAKRMPDVRLAAPVEWQPTWILRAVESVYLTW